VEKKMRRLAIALMVLGVVGCGVVRVSERTDSSDPKKIDGIPFYVKVEKFKKTSTYVQTWLRATLTVEKKAIDTKQGKEVIVDAGKQPFIKDIPKDSLAQLYPIRLKIMNAETQSPGTAAGIVKAFEALALYAQGSAQPELLSNVITSEWVVDRNRTYYLNAPLPWFGNASLTQKLASDGTLTEATSSSDTKLAEGLGALIPFKEFLTGEFVETPTQATANAISDAEKARIRSALMGFDRQTSIVPFAEIEKDRRIVYAITLSVEEVGYEYTLATVPQSEPIVDLSAISFVNGGAGPSLFTRKVIGAKTNEEKKTEGQKIGITGTVEFPKGWGGETTPTK
jgi:hypothetical protein